MKKRLFNGLPLCEFQSKEVVSLPIRTVQILQGVGLKRQHLQANLNSSPLNFEIMQEYEISQVITQIVVPLQCTRPELSGLV